MSKKEKIYTVKTLILKELRTSPIVLTIECDGETNSSGWDCPELIPHIYPVPPANGMYEFDFVAKPPEDATVPVISDITVKYTWLNRPDSLEGIIVYSINNKIEKYK